MGTTYAIVAKLPVASNSPLETNTNNFEFTSSLNKSWPAQSSPCSKLLDVMVISPDEEDPFLSNSWSLNNGLIFPSDGPPYLMKSQNINLFTCFQLGRKIFIVFYIWSSVSFKIWPSMTPIVCIFVIYFNLSLFSGLLMVQLSEYSFVITIIQNNIAVIKLKPVIYWT